MKKLILMTSALVMVGGAAFADIAVTAEASVTYGNWETLPGTAATFSYAAKIDLAMEETTGNLTYGADVTIDVDANTTNDFSVWVSGGFGKVSFGVDQFDELNANNSPAAFDVNGDNKDSDYGDVKYDGTFGAVAVTLVADAKLGNSPSVALSGTNVIAATEPTWWANIAYDGGSWNAGVEADSTNWAELSFSADIGSFKVGGNVDNSATTKYDVWVSSTFSGVNIKVNYDEAGVTALNLDGKAGDISWAVGGDSTGAATASIDYAMGDLSVGLAYDNDDAGTTAGGGLGVADVGDAADVILTVGYSVGMLDFELLANDQSEYEVSVTAGFTF